MSENRRRKNTAEMTLTEQIESIKEQMCDEYCHYHKTYVYQSDVDEKCKECPLKRL